jgi:glycosyltransferase involved in cell wall biosynthesis/predicted O-methyltransferase YrrM
MQISRWRWLRRWVEHNWYTDRRNPDVGFANRDEVAILYNAARLVHGKPCLEIGCWRGWSAVHLALGSGMLDVIDPIIADSGFAESVRQSCEAAGVLDAITFHTGSSPAAVDALAYASRKKWSLIFVDGDHEGDAPRLDAEAAMRHAADTAMVFFHDLASPYVAAGLDVMRNAGWRTMVYQTMQIMGVAWRGNIKPPEHTPDPSVFWTLPSHLAKYHVSKWQRQITSADRGWWPGMTMADRRDAAMMRAQAAEDRTLAAEDRALAAEDRALAVTTAHMADASKLRHKIAQRDNQIIDLGVQLEAQQAVQLEAQQVAKQHLARFITGRRVLLGLLRRSASERFKAVRAHAAGTQINHLLSDEFLHRLLQRRVLIGLARRSKLAREAIVARIMAESRVEDLQQAPRLVANVGPTAALGGNCNPATIPLTEASSAASPNNAPPPTRGNAGKGGAVGPHPTERVSLVQAAATRVRQSGLFDASFYKRQAGIAGEETDAAVHYVLVGDALGLHPSKSFDPAYYGDRNPDVVAAGMNRLLHYLSSGRDEGRHPFPPLVSPRVNKERMDASRENIILVVHEASRTGAPLLGLNVARHLATRYNVFTVTLGGGPLIEAFEALSAEIYGPLENHPVDVEYGLRRLLNEHTFKYAIVNSCESRSAIETCTKRLIPTIMLAHEFGSLYPPNSLRTAFDMASEIVFPAQIVARSSLEMYPPLRKRPVRILPQGVCVLPGTIAPPVQSLPAVDALARAREEGAFIVLGVGTVNFRKGVDLFLAAAMAVRREAGGNRVHFLWVGQGYRPKEDMLYSVYLREQLERSGLQDYVTFLDEVSDLEPIYALADTFLLTSRLDPLPNVVIDSAHRGIPIVCFKNATGAADLLLSDPETALGVVDYLDPIAAGRVILSLAGDPDSWTRMAAATENLARSVFDMAKYVEAIDALGTAASIANDGLTRSTRVLPQARGAGGLTEALTHLPGIFR